MSGDDLTPFLMPGPKSDVGFHSGVVVTWNADTGENTIEVAGAFLTDVPILNTGEAIALKAGHVVGLLRFKQTYFVLGRVTVPGSADFASASVAFGSVSAFAFNFQLSPTLLDKITADIAVPAWADQALVLATADCTGANPGAVDIIQCAAKIDGVVGDENAAVQAAANQGMAVGASLTSIVNNPGTTITIAASMRSITGTFVNASNRASIVGLAVFRSTV